MTSVRALFTGVQVLLVSSQEFLPQERRAKSQAPRATSIQIRQLIKSSAWNYKEREQLPAPWECNLIQKVFQ